MSIDLKGQISQLEAHSRVLKATNTRPTVMEYNQAIALAYAILKIKNDTISELEEDNKRLLVNSKQD